MVEGAILNGASWRWIFVINVPLVLVCLWLIRKSVPASPPATARRKVDVVGARPGVPGLGGSVVALMRPPPLGCAYPRFAGALIARSRLCVCCPPDRVLIHC